MAILGKKSLENLEECHILIQKVIKKAIKYYDFSVICGHRTNEKQFELYKKGRTLENNIWIVKNKKQIVTNCDGLEILSMHNYMPSLAVDCEPYPKPSIKNKKKECGYMAGVIMTIATKMKIELEWGGFWNFEDIYHFQLKNWKKLLKRA